MAGKVNVKISGLIYKELLRDPLNMQKIFGPFKLYTLKAQIIEENLKN